MCCGFGKAGKRGAAPRVRDKEKKVARQGLFKAVWDVCSLKEAVSKRQQATWAVGGEARGGGGVIVQQRSGFTLSGMRSVSWFSYSVALVS